MKYYLYTRTVAEDFPPVEGFSLGFSEKETPELLAEFREWFLSSGKYALTVSANNNQRIFWLRTRDSQRRDIRNRPIACFAAIVAEPNEEEHIRGFFARLILEEELRDRACEALCNDARKAEPPETTDSNWRQPSCSQEWPSEELKHVVRDYQKASTEPTSTDSALRTINQDNKSNRQEVASQLRKGKRISVALGEYLPPKSLQSATNYWFLLPAEHIEAGREPLDWFDQIRNSEAGKQAEKQARILVERVRKYWPQLLLLFLAVVLIFLSVENWRLAGQVADLQAKVESLEQTTDGQMEELREQIDQLHQENEKLRQLLAGAPTTD